MARKGPKQKPATKAGLKKVRPVGGSSSPAGHLYYGDNLEVMRRHVADESLDLVYLDPPFQSGKDYNVLFEEKDGSESTAQIKAFEDTWQWGVEAEEAYQEVVESGGGVADAMHALRSFLGDNDMMAYLSMMAPRLVELHRCLKPTGSIYLHCDPTASHYLKILMDSVFGAKQFQNEFIWYYSGGGASKRRWARKHDVLLFYSKGSTWTFNADDVRTAYKWTRGQLRADGSKRNLKTGKLPDDVWEHHSLMPWSRERLGYPTQKPEELLERIIRASSNTGDTILDPFCGCGTTIAVAQRLGRPWIGIDITHLAIGLIKHRLRNAFEDANFNVIGEPVSVQDAAQLAKEDPYQFQWWILGLVGARGTEQKKGADRGIDGRLYFHEGARGGKGGKTKQIISSVKSGKPAVSHVRDLRGVVEREKAEIGALLLMQDPTKAMVREAASAGFYDSPWGRHPKIQILTAEQLLRGYQLDYPARRYSNVTHRRVLKVRPPDRSEQLELDVG